MRLALVTNAPPDSGMGTPARLLAGALRERLDPADTLDEFFLDASAHAVMKNGQTLQATRPWTRVKPLAWIRLGRALLPRLRGYDVVHLTNQTLSFLVPVLKTSDPRRKTLVILTVWDLIERTHPQERGGALAARVLYRGIPRADQVIAVSQATAAEVQRLYGVPSDRLSVIPPAVRPQFTCDAGFSGSIGARSFRAAQGLSEDMPVILYVGSEHPRKNLRRLVEAIAAARRTTPNLRFVKIGGAGSRAGRRAFLAALDRANLWPAFRRLDRASGEELVSWYRAATVLAFPTLHEGFGFPPLEAMACGTPVVTSNTSSLPEVVGDAAVTVDPTDVHAIAAALTRVLQDSALRADLRARGLRRAAAFTWDRAADATLAVYHRVLRS